MAKIGAHISVDDIGELNPEQVFLTNPHTGELTQLDKIIPKNVDIFVHCSYIAQTPEQIEKEYNAANKIHAKGFVVHLKKDKLRNNLQFAEDLLKFKKQTKIIFEIPGVHSDKHNAGVSETFETPEKINAFIYGLRLKKFDFHDFGICIDTAHLWVGGTDISSHKSMTRFLNKLQERYIALFHLNDNENPIGTKDHHAPVGHGKIWPGYLKNPITTGAQALLNYAKKHDIDVIIERSGESAFQKMHEIAELYNPKIRFE